MWVDGCGMDELLIMLIFFWIDVVLLFFVIVVFIGVFCFLMGFGCK